MGHNDKNKAQSKDEDAVRTAEEQAQLRAREYRILASIGQIISLSPDIGEVYERFTQQVGQLIPFDRIAINQLHAEHQALTGAYVEGVEVPGRRAGDTFPLKGTLTEAVIYSPPGLLLQGQTENYLAAQFPGLLPEFQAGLRSFLSVPLLARGHPEGGLNLRSSKPNAYSQRDLNLLAAVGAQIAGAIANARLYQRAKQAEESLTLQAQELTRSNADLEQFANVASHDLQEPLRAVAGYTQRLQKRYKGKLDEEADEFIAYAVDGAERMQVLIDDLLAYSRVATQELELGTTDCNAVFDQTLTNLKVAIEDSDAKVTRDDLPTLTADSSQMGRLFQNLLANAIKFRREEPPTVHVSAEPRNGAWLLSFRDNGLGIAPQHRDRIFLIFERLRSRFQYAGTGIGLAVCKRIVERHQGDIWVESEPGVGTKFYVSLPNTQEGGVWL